MISKDNVGKYGWILENIKEIAPIEVKGRLGLWNFM